MLNKKNKIITCTLIFVIFLLTINTSYATETFNDLKYDIGNTNDGGTLFLTDDYINTDNVNITIKKNINIDGQGHIIDFNQQNNKHITINSGFTVTLKNLKLKNGYNYEDSYFDYARHDGGAINNKGTLNIINSTFTNNQAENGGGVSNYGDLTITDSIFINNIASFGGAIYTQGTVNITNSIFNNNRVEYYGGAIYNNGTLNITASSFIFNRAEFSGPAIYNDYPGKFNISQSILTTSGIENYVIYNANYDEKVFAEGNFWDNKNPDGLLWNEVPNSDNLANFPVKNYYRFVLTKNSNNIYFGDTITLSLSFGLNSTGANTWTGPAIERFSTIFTSSKPTTVTLKKINNNKATFKAKTNGIYTITAKINKYSRTTIRFTVKALTIKSTSPRNGQKGYSRTKTIVITFNEKIRKYSRKYYSKIYVKNLKTKRKMKITTKIIGSKLYIKMKIRRSLRTYYQIYIPQYAVVNYKKKTITKSKLIKFRT